MAKTLDDACFNIATHAIAHGDEGIYGEAPLMIFRLKLLRDILQEECE